MPKSPRKRRWFRFGLRTLFIAVSIIALVSAWIAYKMQPAWRQRNAVRAIERLGGKFDYDYQAEFRDGDTVRSRSPAPDPEWQRRLLGDDYFYSVPCVYLHNTQTKDDDLGLLLNLPDLCVLNLSRTRITDEGLGIVGQLCELRCLLLADCNITDAGLGHLTNLKHLWRLDLRRCTRITDRGMRSVAKLPGLRKLQLADSPISDEGVQWLVQQGRMETLYLEKTAISDAGLKHLEQLTNLQRLRLADTAITDRGLTHLHNIHTLLVLDVWDTSVTSQALADLKSALPSINIRQ